LSVVFAVCCQRSLRRADHSSRIALRSVIVKPQQWGGAGPLGSYVMGKWDMKCIKSFTMGSLVTVLKVRFYFFLGWQLRCCVMFCHLTGMFLVYCTVCVDARSMDVRMVVWVTWSRRRCVRAHSGAAGTERLRWLFSSRSATWPREPPAIDIGTARRSAKRIIQNTSVDTAY
jgi:hypothetical protein